VSLRILVRAGAGAGGASQGGSASGAIKGVPEVVAPSKTQVDKSDVIYTSNR